MITYIGKWVKVAKKCLKTRIRAYYMLLVRNKIMNLAKINKKRPLFWGIKWSKNGTIICIKN